MKDRAIFAVIKAIVAIVGGLMIPVLVIVTTAPLWGIGFLGALGLTTTVVTVIAIPAAGLVLFVGIVLWVRYRFRKVLRS